VAAAASTRSQDLSKLPSRATKPPEVSIERHHPQRAKCEPFARRALQHAPDGCMNAGCRGCGRESRTCAGQAECRQHDLGTR
jgi:hypothetical protein